LPADDDVQPDEVNFVDSPLGFGLAGKGTGPHPGAFALGELHLIEKHRNTRV